MTRIAQTIIDSPMQEFVLPALQIFVEVKTIFNKPCAQERRRTRNWMRNFSREYYDFRSNYTNLFLQFVHFLNFTAVFFFLINVLQNTGVSREVVEYKNQKF
jgi:hypothetical protein